ncbi:MAG TPA: DNA-binding protein [Pseudomonas sp.]|uniref:DNA-binding protein n=1 Tax=Pseudomonas sp. TaxID=306 RepID=UPI000EED8EA3|nr:DNA-binding protein [Pseudomonas sp.]HCS08676.1 DNA-binding protein [Pseudomonas sp.]
MTIEQEIIARLELDGVVPLLGGLVPEADTAKLLGYAPSYLRRLAAARQSPVPYVLRGNRRFYRVADIGRFVTETV